MEARVKRLEEELEVSKEIIIERKKLIHSFRMNAISCTDPVQMRMDNKNEDESES